MRFALTAILAGLFALSIQAPRAAAQDTARVVVVPPDTTTAPRLENVRLYVRDAGPGRSGRLLREAFQRPYGVLFADSLAARPREFPRGAVYDRTIVVVGGDAAFAGRVSGDVIVIGGGLFLRPGAEIDGRAVAIGGGVYNSTLAVVRGGRESFMTNTFVATRTADGIALDYREIDTYERPLVEIIGLYGFGLPRYDRSNGLAIGWGPLINLRGGRIEFEPAVTYRSHLGAFDPDGIVRWHVSRRSDVVVQGGRGSLSNEGWIRGDIANSVASLLAGSDSRNWRRADRVEAQFTRRWETETSLLEPYVGALSEYAWSTGPGLDPEHGVWSLLERNDRVDGMLRPNPPVVKGNVSSGVAGAAYRWEAQGLRATMSARVEAPFRAPDDARFVQASLDWGFAFVVVRTHRLDVDGHALFTQGDDAPPQRWTYLGGAATIPTLDMLEKGGDHLFLLDSRYTIPIDRIRVPYLGAPSVGVHHVIGSAGVGRLPAFTQNIGARVSIGFLRAEYMFDPKERDSDFSFGFALGR